MYTYIHTTLGKRPLAHYTNPRFFSGVAAQVALQLRVLLEHLGALAMGAAETGATAGRHPGGRSQTHASFVEEVTLYYLF
jgi:hypothetical protein